MISPLQRIMIPGLRGHFNTFLDDESQYNVLQTSRHLRNAIVQELSSTAFARLKHCHQLMLNPGHTLTVDSQQRLMAVPLRTFLESGGCCRRLLNRIQYYTGYHNYRMHKAIARTNQQLQNTMQQIVTTCRELQSAPYVNLNQINQYYLSIHPIKAASRYLLLCSNLQSQALTIAIAQRFCLLKCILSIFQAIFSRLISRIRITHCHHMAEAAQEAVRKGCSQVHDFRGYPIGRTTVIKRNGAKTAITVYAQIEYQSKKFMRGFYFTLATQYNIYGNFRVKRYGFNSSSRVQTDEERMPFIPIQRSSRGIHFSDSFMYELNGNIEIANQNWLKMMQIAVEILGRENQNTLTFNVGNNRDYEIFAAGGCSFGLSRSVKMKSLKEAREKGFLFTPHVHSSYSGAKACLYKAPSGTHPDTIYFTDSQHKEPAQVMFTLDNSSMTWEQRIAQEGRILGGTGPVLPALVCLDEIESKEKEATRV